MPTTTTRSYGTVPACLADWKSNSPALGGWWTLPDARTALIGILVSHPHRARFYIHDIRGDRQALIDLEVEGATDEEACRAVLRAALAAGFVTKQRKSVGARRAQKGDDR